MFRRKKGSADLKGFTTMSWKGEKVRFLLAKLSQSRKGETES